VRLGQRPPLGRLARSAIPSTTPAPEIADYCELMHAAIVQRHPFNAMSLGLSDRDQGRLRGIKARRTGVRERG
jgi:hypothetical protein